MKQVKAPSGEGLRTLSLVVTMPMVEARGGRDYVVIGGRGRKRHSKHEAEKAILAQLPWYSRMVIPTIDSTALLSALNQWDFGQVEKAMKAQSLAMQRATATLQLVQNAINIQDDIVTEDIKKEFSQILWKEVRAKLGGSYRSADLALVTGLRDIMDYLSDSGISSESGLDETGDEQVYDYINSFWIEDIQPAMSSQSLEQRKQQLDQAAYSLASSYSELLERHVFKNAAAPLLFGAAAPATLPAPGPALLMTVKDEVASPFQMQQPFAATSFGSPMFGGPQMGGPSLFAGLGGSASPEMMRQKWMDQVRLAMYLDAPYDVQQFASKLAQMRDQLNKVELTAKKRVKCIKQLMLLCSATRDVLNSTAFWMRQAPAHRWLRACVATRINDFIRNQTSHGSHVMTALQGELAISNLKVDYEYLRWLDMAKRHSPSNYHALLNKWHAAPNRAPALCRLWEDRTRVLLITEEKLRLVGKADRVQRGDCTARVEPIMLTEAELDAIEHNEHYVETEEGEGSTNSILSPSRKQRPRNVEQKGDLVYSLSDLNKRYQAEEKKEKKCWIRRRLHI